MSTLIFLLKSRHRNSSNDTDRRFNPNCDQITRAFTARKMCEDSNISLSLSKVIHHKLTKDTF